MKGIKIIRARLVKGGRGWYNTIFLPLNISTKN